MTSSVLVDTNVLVYAYDLSEPVKQPRAIEVLDSLALRGQGVLTTQVLAEFFVIATSRIREPLSVTVAREQVNAFCDGWPVLDVTPMVIREALRGVQEYHLHYWDAQLWAAAKLNQIPFIFSEDLPSSDSLEGVKYIDPFGPSNGTDCLGILAP
jgi:predicted nucleic acid-binding protein